MLGFVYNEGFVDMTETMENKRKPDMELNSVSENVEENTDSQTIDYNEDTFYGQTRVDVRINICAYFNKLKSNTRK